ncbi:hypothetical protein [Actinomadura fibrosa]|uniref:Uncharacterized protein n=1 Tax=Actinomadura fibrosa TaxID=111802 RepID=A0ABW2XVQ4_9ACTN|nr:hypothetical protein [Actinomadura fibrosa]
MDSITEEVQGGDAAAFAFEAVQNDSAHTGDSAQSGCGCWGTCGCNSCHS